MCLHLIVPTSSHSLTLKSVKQTWASSSVPTANYSQKLSWLITVYREGMVRRRIPHSGQLPYTDYELQANLGPIHLLSPTPFLRLIMLHSSCCCPGGEWRDKAGCSSSYTAFLTFSHSEIDSWSSPSLLFPHPIFRIGMNSPLDYYNISAV